MLSGDNCRALCVSKLLLSRRHAVETSAAAAAARSVSPRDRQRQPLAVGKRLRHRLAEGLGEEEGGQARGEGEAPEDLGRPPAQQEDVGGEDRACAADDDAEAHPDAPHHRGKLLGGEQVQDRVRAVGREPRGKGGKLS